MKALKDVGKLTRAPWRIVAEDMNDALTEHASGGGAVGRFGAVLVSEIFGAALIR
ncbi:hypothetical protein IGX34_14075 [Dyella sp. 7MK23]|uniref:Uncharacterized protein n=1 Tax=Dyella acidiphila TaxID=2775866 RepID=A0ABR9GBT8_9GAMM|nr:hypothetical protein [Dyella acidiphila]